MESSEGYTIKAADGEVAMALALRRQVGSNPLPPTSIIVNNGVSGVGYVQPRIGTDDVSW
jgi:hypothetical protein